MDGIKEIALTFCATAVATAALAMLKGRGMEKSGQYIIGILFLCAVVSAVFSADVRFNFPKTETADLYYNEEKMCEVQAEYLVASYLKEHNIKFEKICCRANKTEESGIVISEVVIYGTEDGGAQALLKELGIDCKVTVK